jgi:putative transposase
MRPTYATTWLSEDPRAVRHYDQGGHTHHRLDYHFVWRTKYNKTILGPVLAPFLVERIGAICAERRVTLLGLAIAANHVHLCARLRPSQSPAQVMKWIKGSSSLEASERFPQLEQRFGVRHLWAQGYHVESLGEKSIFAILAYLGRQDEKHDLKALEGDFEEIDRLLSGAAERDEGGEE